MSVRLREALRETAAGVPAYQVHDRAVRTARRTRRRMAAAVAAVLVLVALVPVAVRGGGEGPAVEPAGAEGPALPDRIGLPAFGALHATDRPRLGPASVIYSGQARGLTGLLDEDGTVGIVGAEEDRYRTYRVGFEAPAGTTVFLSPDGRWIAAPGGGSEDPRIDLVDLVDGKVRHLPSVVPESGYTEPAGWSPDGTSLVVRDAVPANPEGSSYRNVLTLVRVDGGRAVRLTEGAQAPIFGAPVAFSPDGTRLAFQVHSEVVVTGLDGQRLAAFPASTDGGLAGKGAWLPDGTLTIVSRDPGTTRWRLRRVDPATGRDLGGLELPAVTGVTAVRLLGWRPDGSALVVAYRPEPAAPAAFDAPLEMDQRTAYGNVRSVEVLALAPGAAAPDTVLTAPEQVLGLDVADDVVHSGRVRAADPPLPVGGRFWWWTGLAAALALLGYLTRRRARRRRLTRAGAAGG